MKTLLIAFECSPYRGSEWTVGWGRLLGAARIGEAHVITTAENKIILERAAAEGRMPAGVTIHAPTTDRKLARLERRPRLFAYNYGALNYWHRLAFAMARELHARERFDVIHQANVCTFREPGYTWQLDAPWVWGPLGGAQNVPWRMLGMLPPLERVKEGVRSLVNWMALHKPRVRHAAERADVLLAANSENRRIYQRLFGSGRPIEQMLETGVHEVAEPDPLRCERRIAAKRAAEGRGPAAVETALAALPLRLLWSGEFQSRKALPILLRALAKLDRERAPVSWELEVLGDGPMERPWLAEIRRLGLASRIRLRGRLEYTAAVAAMRRADLFCFTSLRDTSGNVVLESLAAGTPVVCFHHQGAADMIDDRSGIRLPVRSARQAVDDWASTIRMLAQDPDRLRQLSLGATARARTFLWPENQDRMNAVYLRLAQRSERRRLHTAGAGLAEDGRASNAGSGGHGPRISRRGGVGA